MKKIISIICIILLIVTIASCQKADSKMLQDLKEKYPDATIERKNGKYHVYSDSDLTGVDISDDSGEVSGNAPLYETLDDLLNAMNFTRDSIFIGEKTDESKQYLEYSDTGILYNWGTETKVKVKKTLYGDIKEGDEIIYREHYAIITEHDESVITGEKPSSSKECIYIVSNDGKSKLFDRTAYNSMNINHRPLELEKFAQFDYENLTDATVNQLLYKKYVIDGDTALDEEKELKKALDWKKEYESRLANAGKSKMSKEEIEKMTLTDGESAKIKELVKRYNNISRQ